MKNILLAGLLVLSTSMSFAQQQVNTQGNFERIGNPTKLQSQYLAIAESLNLMGNDNSVYIKIIERVRFTNSRSAQFQSDGIIQLSGRKWLATNNEGRANIVKSTIQILEATSE
ncbi:MAG: hypothetical protein H7061_05555 [Bdellovibrionaceae bacterium]|nr:hypothetical protein [Bdellovibrio sp.]